MQYIIEIPKRYANKNGMYGQPLATLTIDVDSPHKEAVVDLLETLLDKGFSMHS